MYVLSLDEEAVCSLYLRELCPIIKVTITAGSSEGGEGLNKSAWSLGGPGHLLSGACWAALGDLHSISYCHTIKKWIENANPIT